MPEKTAKQVEKELRIIALYKWEFLRRNKEYQEDYDRYAKEEQKMRFRLEGEEKFDSWKQEQASEFFVKWGILYPYNYKNKNLGHDLDVSNDSPPVMRQMKLPFKGKRGKIVRKNYPVWGDLVVNVNGREVRIPDTVVFSFNLNYPKGKIMPLLEKELDKLIEKRSELLKKYNVKPSYKQAQITPLSLKKRNLYDEYLRIWDAVEKYKNKRTWAWMAKKLYPTGTVSEHNMRERYKECKAMVDGGYVDIK